MSPGWLTRIETLGTTVVVLMVGAMMIWYEAVLRGRHLVVTISCAVILYLAVLVLSARRSSPTGISWWPFAAAGLVTLMKGELLPP